MQRDFIITTNASDEDSFYFVGDIDTLPRSAIAFKIVKNIDGKMNTTDYKIGVPIDKPMKLLGNEGAININENGKAEYGIYSDGATVKIFNIGPNTAVVDNFDVLLAAFVAETKQDKYVRG